MKKFLNSLIIIFVFMFIGIVNVEAASSSLIKDGRNYKFTWTGLTNMDYITYTLNCSGGTSVSGEGGNTGGMVTSDNGYVVLSPSENTLSCKITNGSGEVVVESSVDITSNTTKSTQTTTTTQAQTTVAKSNNANLKSLSVKTSDDRVVEITPKFDAGITEYSATVDSSVKTVNVEAIMEDSKANVVLSKNASEELNAGENNKITITVTAEDGTKRAYTLNIKREALTADATLKTLIIKEAKNFKLKTDQYSYSIKVANDVKKLSLDIETSDDTATYVIEGNESLKDGSIVKIIVTAEDGTKKVYKLNISKVSTTTKKKVVVNAEKNPLIIMGLSIIAFGLIGGIIYVIKK